MQKPARAAKAASKAEAPQEVAVPAAPAPLAPTGKTPGEAWKTMMDTLKRSDPATYSFLTQGRFEGCEGDVYRWYAKPGLDFYVRALNGDAKRGSIVQALTQAFPPRRFRKLHIGGVLTSLYQLLNAYRCILPCKMLSRVGKTRCMACRQPNARCIKPCAQVMAFQS